ncbi:MAG: hypothetical protein N2C12_15545, partial [Planctomycetales bacterium]
MSIRQAILFIPVDLEVFGYACGVDGDALCRQVDRYRCFGIRIDGCEELGQEVFGHLHRKNAVIERISFENIAKKLETTTLMPYPAMALAACSRLDPLPKFLPPTK